MEFYYTCEKTYNLSAIFLSQLMHISIKVADISNEARPMDVSEPWIDCLLQEFFNQVMSKVYAVFYRSVIFVQQV